MRYPGGIRRFPVPLGSYHKFPRGTKAPSNGSLSAALQGPNTVSRTFRLHAIQRRLQFPADVVRRRPVPQTPSAIACATPAR